MIYFITDGTYTKIGYTGGDVMYRMSCLQTGNALKLKLLFSLEGDVKDEALLQNHFKDFSVGGEWFLIDTNKVSKESVEGLIEGLREIGSVSKKYVVSTIAKNRKKRKTSLIYNAMLAIRESDQPVTIKNISRLTKIPESTIYNYISEFSDMADELSFVDGRSLIKDRILHDLESAIDEMKQRGMDVTKSELHRYTGISRPTINKYWGRLLKKVA